MRTSVLLLPTLLLILPTYGFAASASASAVAGPGGATASSSASTSLVRDERTTVRITPQPPVPRIEEQEIVRTLRNTSAAQETREDQRTDTPERERPGTETPAAIAQAIDDARVETALTNVTEETSRLRLLLSITLGLLAVDTLLLVTLLFLVMRTQRTLPPQRF